jgi:type II secretory pathway component PulF
MANPLGGNLSRRSRLVLYAKLAHSLENGQSVEFALEGVLKRLAKRGKKSEARRIQHILDARINGASFTEAMGRQIPEQEAGVLAAGEISGRLAASLRLVLERDAQRRRVRDAVSQALAPALLNLFMLFAALYVIGGYVMPAMGKIIPPNRWQGSARLLYLAGELVLGWHGPALIGSLVSLVVIVLFMLPRYTGRGRVFLENNVFPFGLYRDVVGLDWGMSLAAMLSAGMSDVEAIEKQSVYANAWMRSRLDAAHSRMRSAGENLPDALEATGLNFPSPELIQDIASISGFPDFYERLPPMLEANSHDVEKQVKGAFSLVGITINLLVYTLFGLVQIASNNIGSQVSNIMH